MNKWKAFRVLVVLSGLLSVGGCSSKQASLKHYQLEGTVVAVDKPQHQVTINHKEIPGLMGAMTMPYTLLDDSALDKLSAGDSITATVAVRDSKIWLEDIHVVKPGPRGRTENHPPAVQVRPRV